MSFATATPFPTATARRARALLASRYLWLALAALVLFLGSHGVAHAATTGGGGGMPWEGPLEKLRASIAGPVAFVIALLGIIACGATLIWGGEISEFTKRIIYVVLVICLLVSANSILTNLFSASGATVDAGLRVSPRELAAFEPAVAGTGAR